MKNDGEELIKIICKRLAAKNVLLYDSNILLAIKKLTQEQLNQIISFGNVQKWHNDEINKNN